jgi:hypothetical protein
MTIGGTVRSHRDRQVMAIDAAMRLKTKQPHDEVTVEAA